MEKEFLDFSLSFPDNFLYFREFADENEFKKHGLSMDEVGMPREHVFFFHKETTRYFLHKAGFKILEIQYVSLEQPVYGSTGKEILSVVAEKQLWSWWGIIYVVLKNKCKWFWKLSMLCFYNKNIYLNEERRFLMSYNRYILFDYKNSHGSDFLLKFINIIYQV